MAAAQQNTFVLTAAEYLAAIRVAAHKKLIAEVETDRARFMELLVAQWAPAAAALGYVEGWADAFQAALAAATADRLAGVSEAKTCDQVRALLAGNGVQGRIGTVSLSKALTSQGLPSEVVTAQALGDTTTDLVFYPIQPCRVLDTRLSTAGPIAYNGTRNFNVNSNLANQGGNAAGCGMPTDPIAVAHNITSTNQDRIGHLRLYPFSTTPPNASILDFQAGTNVANAAIVQNCYLCGYDFTVESDWATSEIIWDVLGYFRSPTYTPLQQTVEVSTGTTLTTGAWNTVDSPACRTGYVLAGGGVNWTGAIANVWIWQSRPLDDGSAYRARVNNQSGSTITVYTSGICARVPGR